MTLMQKKNIEHCTMICIHGWNKGFNDEQLHFIIQENERHCACVSISKKNVLFLKSFV